MKHFLPCMYKTLAAAVVIGGLFNVVAPAFADTFYIQYFEGKTGTPDFYNGLKVPIGTSFNYVQSTLGPHGLPVFNSEFTAVGTVLAPNSAYLDPVTHELLYWTPGAGPVGSTIKADGSGIISLTSASSHMFAPGTGGADAVYQETAILKGSFYLASAAPVTFSVGGDDAAFVYVDGNLVDSLGGIHGNTTVTGSTTAYLAGTHDVVLFYADHDVVEASLSLNEIESPVNITPTVPEPGSLLLMGTGLLGAASALRRQLSR